MCEYNGMTDAKEITRRINRHKARMLCNLEDAGCPSVFVDAVRSGLDWLRSDVQEITDGDERHEQIHKADSV